MATVRFVNVYGDLTAWLYRETDVGLMATYRDFANNEANPPIGLPGAAIHVWALNDTDLQAVTEVRIGLQPCDFTVAYDSNWGRYILTLWIPQMSGSDELVVVNPDGVGSYAGGRVPTISVVESTPTSWYAGHDGTPIGYDAGFVNSWTTSAIYGTAVDTGLPLVTAPDGTVVNDNYDMTHHLFTATTSSANTGEAYNAHDSGSSGGSSLIFSRVAMQSSWQNFGIQGMRRRDVATQTAAFVDVGWFAQNPDFLPLALPTDDGRWGTDLGRVVEFDTSQQPAIRYDQNWDLTFSFLSTSIRIREVDTSSSDEYVQPGVTLDATRQYYFDRIMASSIRIYKSPDSLLSGNVVPVTVPNPSGNIGRDWNQPVQEANVIESYSLVAQIPVSSLWPASRQWPDMVTFTVSVPGSWFNNSLNACGFYVVSSFVDDHAGVDTPPIPTGYPITSQTSTVAALETNVKASVAMKWRSLPYRYYFLREASRFETPDLDAAFRYGRISFNPAGGRA